MAPPRICKVFSGFAPDLQIDLKRPCSSLLLFSHLFNVYVPIIYFLYTQFSCIPLSIIKTLLLHIIDLKTVNLLRNILLWLVGCSWKQISSQE